MAAQQIAALFNIQNTCLHGEDTCHNVLGLCYSMNYSKMHVLLLLALE